MTTMKPKRPSAQLVQKTLGKAQATWDAVVNRLTAEYGDLANEWKNSKSAFGWMCLIKSKKRTVVYLTPEPDAVRVSIVLGERAVQRALAGVLPEPIKKLIREAQPYFEGRGIRFPINKRADVSVVMELVARKMAK